VSIADGDLSALPGSTWCRQEVFARASVGDHEFEERRVVYGDSAEYHCGVHHSETFDLPTGNCTEQLNSLLDCLTNKQRRIVELRREGLSFEQIAQAVGSMSAGSVHVTFSRAVIRLKKAAEEI
jgi:DNA-directed RNA polymerase specialized sigma24 family protein